MFVKSIFEPAFTVEELVCLRMPFTYKYSVDVGAEDEFVTLIVLGVLIVANIGFVLIVGGGVCISEVDLPVAIPEKSDRHPLISIFPKNSDSENLGVVLLAKPVKKVAVPVVLPDEI